MVEEVVEADEDFFAFSMNLAALKSSMLRCGSGYRHVFAESAGHSVEGLFTVC